MQIAIEKNTGAFRTFAGAEITTLTKRRNDAFWLDVRFLDGTTPVELATGSGGSALVKKKLEFGGDTLAGDLAWDQTGTGAERIYRFFIDLDTEDMRDLYSSSTTEIEMVLQIAWQESSEERETSIALPLIVQNVYNIGDESLPAPALPYLTNIGNSKFRFGATGEPEWYNEDLEAWVRKTYVGNPPVEQIEVL